MKLKFSVFMINKQKIFLKRTKLLKMFTEGHCEKNFILLSQYIFGKFFKCWRMICGVFHVSEGVGTFLAIFGLAVKKNKTFVSVYFLCIFREKKTFLGDIWTSNKRDKTFLAIFGHQIK